MPNYAVGLDLGQVRDYSALAVVERVLVLPLGLSIGEYHRTGAASIVGAEITEEFHVIALKRWELGTGYPQIVADVAQVMRTDALRRDGFLVFDQTGVGQPVADLFWQAHRDERIGIYPPTGVQITAPVKKNMVDGLLIPLQQRRLKIADTLPLAETLEKELVDFRRKITAAGNTTFEASREDGHGDIASALMLALLYPNTARRPALIENPNTAPLGALS